jgi:L-fucose isomerase-like protein
MNSNDKKPKIGFCIIQNPFEVGADKSKFFLENAASLFSKYEVQFLSFNEIIDDDRKTEKAGQFFYENNIDVLLSIQTTWSNDYHIMDILEYVDVPVILWAIPGMENGSLCGIHQLGVVLSEIEKKYVIFFGEIDDVPTHNKIISFAKAAALKKYLRKQKLGLIGYRTTGMTEVTFDEFELKKKFGPRIVHFGINKILDLVRDVPLKKATDLWNEIKSYGMQINVSDEDGILSIKNYLAFKKLSIVNGLSGFAVECYPELMGQVCLAASLLAKEGIIVSCEGDINSAAAMVMLNFLSGSSVHNTDLLNPDSENSVVFTHCGSGDFDISKDSKEINLCPVRLQNCGVCVTFLPKLGEITLVNIVGRKDSYRISAIEGYSQETGMVFPGNPISARFKISAEKFLEIIAKNAVGHHWMVGYGKLLEELKIFADLIGVKFIEFV